MGWRVLLGDKLVGRLVADDVRRVVAFRFDESYLESAMRPVLGRYFEDFELSAALEFVGADGLPPNFFRNCLPEGALRKLVEQQVERWTFRECALLERLGRDLPGNVILLDDELDSDPEEGEAEIPISKETPPPGTVRFSVAGIQPKISIIIESDQRITVPASGLGGRWFAKLPTRALECLPENEYLMLEWARRSGIAVPDLYLYQPSKIANLPSAFEIVGPNALLVKRFDRSDDGRIHQEDFAQILNLAPDRKYYADVPSSVNYASIAKIIHALCGEADCVEFLKRLVFVILSGNADAHVKNWAILYPDGRKPRLAPAYDFVSTIAYPAFSTDLALDLMGEINPREITYQHLLELAKVAGLNSKVAENTITDIVALSRREWLAVRQMPEMPQAVRKAIDLRLSNINI